MGLPGGAAGILERGYRTSVVIHYSACFILEAMIIFRKMQRTARHTCLLGELFRFPVDECSLCEILLGFPSRRVFLASALVVFPVDQVLDFLADNALVKNSAELVVFVRAVITVGMRRR